MQVGAAILANSRFLYVANDSVVFQYNLRAADINASRITVAICDGFMSPIETAFVSMKLAPNGKIYEVSNGNDCLHVIENPDSAGLACNFRQHAIITPCYNGLSLYKCVTYLVACSCRSGGKLGRTEKNCNCHRAQKVCIL